MAGWFETSFELTITDTLLGAPEAGQAEGETSTCERQAPYGNPGLGGYRLRRSADYDRTLCLDTEFVIGFIKDTQSQDWQKLSNLGSADVEGRFLERLSSEISLRGTLDLLHRGVEFSGCRFRLVYFKHSDESNEASQRLYHANRFSIIPRLVYSVKSEDVLDLVIFVNGLPIFAAIIKNPLAGQTVEDAIQQYRYDLDPAEPLFANGRCLAFFALDSELAYVTTQLDGLNTGFLPFNQGRDGGAGNPPSQMGYPTSYLWRQIWTRDSVLDLIQHYIQGINREDHMGGIPGETNSLFPRYHQLVTVRRLVAHARANGTGRRYLIQHSMGGGKGLTMALLAHQIARLRGQEARRAFDGTIVITDRVALGRQISEMLRKREEPERVVAISDLDGCPLIDSVQSGWRLFVAHPRFLTQILGQIAQLREMRFALVIDGFSGESGGSHRNLRATLEVSNLEEAERIDEVERSGDWEDRIASEVMQLGIMPNTSVFLFSDTPKPQILELFGVRNQDGDCLPFSLYPMRQAIEEGFILDVLENYISSKGYIRLLKSAESDIRFDQTKVSHLRQLLSGLPDHAIGKKAAAIVDHFVEKSSGRIGGKAKAIIVTRSRLHAVRYKLAIDQYLEESGCNFRALVAFPGKVIDGGTEYTEKGMNGLAEDNTADVFRRDEYRCLIVAGCLSAGCDQPLLHTMYVDRNLDGIQAVRTLSLLAIPYPGKEEAVVLDFANEAEDIRKAFAPYYDRTIPDDVIDPRRLEPLSAELASFNFYYQPEVERVVFFALNTQLMRGAQDALWPVIQRYLAANEADRSCFSTLLRDYLRHYSFISNWLPLNDCELEKLFIFSRSLLQRLPLKADTLAVDIKTRVEKLLPCCSYAPWTSCR